MLRHEWLTTQIKRVFEQHKGRYGSPRIALQLYAEGIETNKRVVAMLMQRAGLVSVYSRRRLKNRQQRLKSSASLYQNLLNRDLCNNPSNFLKYGLFPCFLTSVP
ncbi:IS3 family transposase [Oligella urethralis]|uniref:IS3 family transposase n=1 Tax=Oligella urethralis TaxID=90245 RepID=UPI003990CC8F